MNSVISKETETIFLCKACETRSRISLAFPEDGIYRITCYNCNTPSKAKIQNGKFIFLEEVTEEKNNFSLDTLFQDKEKLQKEELSEFISNSKEREQQNSKKPDPSPVSKFLRKAISDIKEKKWIPLFKKETSNFTQPFIRSIKFQKKINVNNFSSNKKILFLTVPVIFFLILTGWNIFEISNYKSEINTLLAELNKNKPSKILDSNGKIVSEIFQKRTSSMKIGDYPNDLKKIILRIEDNNFYSHFGINVFSIFRAMAVNVLSFEYKQGASTITQQLARILINNRKKSIFRKIKEAQIAFALELSLTKDQILEAYLNQVYLGHGAFGFGDAARFYFDKQITDLSQNEIILLASLASAPGKYSPIKNPETSKIRLKSLYTLLTDKGFIKEYQESEINLLYNSLKRKPSDTVFNTRLDKAPYVTEHIRELLKSIDPTISIYEQGGYTVETTLNVEIQDTLDDIVKTHLNNLLLSKQVVKTKIIGGQKVKDDRKIDNNDLQAAVIGVNPTSGEILFFHGGREFSSLNQFNRAIQMRRQTGSTIKPILYAAAIDSGAVHSGTRVLDAPILFRGMKGQKNWAPDNIGMTYDGEISVREALIRSKNTAAVQVAEKLGSEGIDKYYSLFFFPDTKEKQKRFRNDLSVSLGTLEISPLEMAIAFGAFSNDGKIVRPTLIKKITDNTGKIIYTKENKDEFNLKIPKERNVISPDASEVIVSIIKSSANASGFRSTGIKSEIAGKTGTTNDYKDAWFIGTRKNFAMAVWVGYDDQSYGMGNRGMGAVFAAPLWGKIGKKIEDLNLMPKENFTFSKRATFHKICKDSGDLASDTCVNTLSEIFSSNGIPSKICNLKHTKSTKREILKKIF
ncbi:MAG: transglycosylase domain-containing protein [Leptospiraceae bacterium]|nr:transglycosylase domain-containing protein [Leptospiraceae bacterium]MCK6381577.1 transglycosylase domain-containing protein [Leptospiraceae bacterium]NUM40721.1 transglycosylase domain-containing protein [Leptospiraceae bacterium]